MTIGCLQYSSNCVYYYNYSYYCVHGMTSEQSSNYINFQVVLYFMRCHTHYIIMFNTSNMKLYNNIVCQLMYYRNNNNIIMFVLCIIVQPQYINCTRMQTRIAVGFCQSAMSLYYKLTSIRDYHSTTDFYTVYSHPLMLII